MASDPSKTGSKDSSKDSAKSHSKTDSKRSSEPKPSSFSKLSPFSGSGSGSMSSGSSSADSGAPGCDKAKCKKIRCVTNAIAFLLHIIAAIVWTHRVKNGKNVSVVRSIIFIILLELLRWTDALYMKFKCSKGETPQGMSPVDQQYIEKNRKYK